MAVCSTCELVVLLLSMADLPDPMRLLAGAADTVAARMNDSVAANRLMMRVFFII